MKKNPDARKYMKQIKQELPTFNADGKRIKKILLQNVRDYAQEEPEVSYAQLVSRFGSPEEIAAAYLSEQSSGTVKKAVRIRKKILTIVLAVGLVFKVDSDNGIIVLVVFRKPGKSFQPVVGAVVAVVPKRQLMTV